MEISITYDIMMLCMAETREQMLARWKWEDGHGGPVLPARKGKPGQPEEQVIGVRKRFPTLEEDIRKQVVKAEVDKEF